MDFEIVRVAMNIGIIRDIMADSKNDNSNNPYL
jgi:hypothetical protein